jgi:hypothetical protein
LFPLSLWKSSKPGPKKAKEREPLDRDLIPRRIADDHVESRVAPSAEDLRKVDRPMKETVK